MILFIVFLIQISVITYAATIFPISSTSLKQFEQAIWMDCASSASIQGQNCLDDEYLWQECYKVPSKGACLKQNITKQTTTPLNVQINFFDIKDGEKIQFVLGGTEMTEIVKDNYIRVKQAFSSDIALKVLTPNIFLSNLTISSECLPYCSTCNGGYCQTCMPGYWKFFYQCVRDDCDKERDSITSTSLQSSSGTLKDGNYEVAINLNVKLGNCLVPKIYLGKSFLDNSIVYVFQDSEFTVQSQQVNVKLSMSQVFKYCQKIELTDSITYQCFVNLAVAFHQNTQYLLILIGQISIDRSTSATSSSTQSIQLPDDSSIQVGPVLVVSDQTTTVIDLAQKTISTVTIIADPNYSKYFIDFNSAAFTQNGKTFDLTLLKQDLSAGKSSLTLNWIDSNFDPSQSYDLKIYANVVPSKSSRILIAQKSQLTNIKYSISNTLKYNVPQEPIFELDDVDICFVVIGCIIGFLLMMTLISNCCKVKSIVFMNENSHSPQRNNDKQLLQNLQNSGVNSIPPRTSKSGVV